MSNTKVITPTQILQAVKYLDSQGKSIVDLIKVDFASINTAKAYHGARFAKPIEVLVPETSPDGETKYRYIPGPSIKFSKVSVMGCMPHDSDKRQGANKMNISFTPESVDAKGEQLGKALLSIMVAFKAATEIAKKETDPTKTYKGIKNDRVSTSYRTENKDGEPVKNPSISAEIEFEKGPKGEIALNSKPKVSLRDLTKKCSPPIKKIPFKVATVENKPIVYSNIHEFLKNDSKVVGILTLSVCRSSQGLSCRLKVADVLLVEPGKGFKASIEDAFDVGEMSEFAVEDESSTTDALEDDTDTDNPPEKKGADVDSSTLTDDFDP